MPKYAYRCTSHAHQIIELASGAIYRELENSRRYPAHRGLFIRFTQQLNEETRDG